MKENGQIGMEISNNISAIIKTFEDKIILNIKEYNNLIHYQELYYSLRKNFNDELHSEIRKATDSCKDEISKLNKRISDLEKENISLIGQVRKLEKSKNKKCWLW